MRFTLLFTLIFTNFIFGQLSKKHWLPPIHAKSSNVVEDHYVYLSTPEPTPFLVTVKRGNGTSVSGSPFTISKSNPIRVTIGSNESSPMFVSQSNVNTVNADKGLIIEGPKDFYATFKIRAANHAELVVSKGIPGIGTQFRLGSIPQDYGGSARNFMSSFMATEDNTQVVLSDYNIGVIFTSGSGNVTLDNQTFMLNKGQSVVVSGYSDVDNSNFKGFVGALLTSTKPIAVITGNALGGFLTSNDGQDYNLDQIVSYEQIGKEYLIVKGNGSNNSERPLVIATQNNTNVYINGNTTPVANLNAGEYFLIFSSYYQGTNNKNMYVTSDKPIYLYQFLAGSLSDATSGLNFIPPLSCFFQKSVDLIPSIDKIGNNNYTSDLIILTKTGSTITINGNPTSALSEPALGTTEWETYRVSGYTGNVVVESTGPLAVGVFGTDNSAVGFSGYYSGFGSEPRDTEIKLCSNTMTNLLDAIDGNPEPGGVWTPALAGGGDVFDPNIDLPGIYNYTYTGDCSIVDVDINVSEIQQAPLSGVDNTLIICDNEAAIDLFTLLGTTASVGGSWTPAMASGSGIYDPATDSAASYRYTIPGNDVCDEVFSTITVTKNTIPQTTTISDFEICDNNVDGSDTNGFATFNLSTKNAEVLNGQSGIAVTYHVNQNDADNNVNPQNNYYSTTQLVYVRLTNNSTNCYATTSFNLIINPLPVVIDNVNLKQCDTDTDAITEFNLTFANLLISANTTLSYSYFTTLLNAQNNTMPITNTTNYTSANNGAIWTRVTSTKGCLRIVKVNLLVSTTTPVNNKIISECDVFIDSSDPSNDGFDYFDLNEATTFIINQFPPNQSLQVSYYENQANATSGLNPINTSVVYRNTVASNQFLWVRIDSVINNECFGLGQYVELIVDPIPNTDLGQDFVVCLDPNTGLGSQNINATPMTAGNYSYSWTPVNPSTDSLGNQLSIFTVTQSGTYSVEVTNINTQCKNTDSVTATFSSEPLSVSAVLITPLFSPGTASIEAIPVGGYGIYEYSIDGGINWQPGPVFGGLSNGSYTVLVRDIEQCGIQYSQSIQTVTYPPYFTPNGDGINETWNVNGLLGSYDAKIYLFDRYGKLLKEISPNGLGWDGTFNGHPLPSTDYWFKIEFTQDGNRQEFKSHFTLKR